MNRREAKLLIPIITAYANGEALEVQDIDDDPASRWVPCGEASFNFEAYRYRVPPPKPLECWLYVNTTGRALTETAVVEKPANPLYRLFREVME